MKVSFVIPIFNNFSLINQLLVDIKDHCTPSEIVVVDDFSSDQKTLDGLSWWSENFNVKVLRPIENLGFLKSSNYGISRAEGDAVCLISSDVRIEEDLARIVRDLLTVDSKRLIGGIHYTHDTGWNTFDGVTYPYIEGWLLCCTKEAWNDLGGFDEKYAPSDFEDIDISTTALSKGYELYPINSPRIRHLGGQTYGYNDERMARTVQNKEKFRQKWITKSSEPA